MLQEKISKDMVEALKANDQIKTSTLRMLNSVIHNAVIAKRPKELEESDIVDIIAKQIKQRSESIEQFKKGNRPDLVDKETKELEILKSYMPGALSEEEVTKIVKDAIAQTGAKAKQDMGKVMKEVMPKVKGRYDSKMLSELVNKCLS
jgi:uncharacterized protein YqeY